MVQEAIEAVAGAAGVSVVCASDVDAAMIRYSFGFFRWVELRR